MVCFNSVEARDLVQSHAKNLAQYVDKDNTPLAGMRMEIPERLLGDFKLMERYGHAMRIKHKEKFKRHIKMDDACMCIYMDAFVPKVGEWVRIEMDTAREDNAKRMHKKTKGNQRKLFCTVDSDSDAEK